MSKPLTIKRSTASETDPLPSEEGLDAVTSTADPLPVEVEVPPAPTSSEAPAAKAEEYGRGGVYRSIGGGRRVKK